GRPQARRPRAPTRTSALRRSTRARPRSVREALSRGPPPMKGRELEQGEGQGKRDPDAISVFARRRLDPGELLGLRRRIRRLRPLTQGRNLVASAQAHRDQREGAPALFDLIEARLFELDAKFPRR